MKTTQLLCASPFQHPQLAFYPTQDNGHRFCLDAVSFFLLIKYNEMHFVAQTMKITKFCFMEHKMNHRGISKSPVWLFWAI